MQEVTSPPLLCPSPISCVHEEEQQQRPSDGIVEAAGEDAAGADTNDDAPLSPGLEDLTALLAGEGAGRAASRKWHGDRVAQLATVHPSLRLPAAWPRRPSRGHALSLAGNRVH